MNRAAVAIVEPAYYGRGYVVAAKDLGLQVVAIVSNIDLLDEFNYRHLVDFIVEEKDTIEPLYLIEAVRNAPCFDSINAIIAGNEFLLETCARVSSHFGFKTNSEDSYKASLDKYLARELYLGAGIPSLRYVDLLDVDEVGRITSYVGFPGVIKPVDSWSSQGVKICRSVDELISYFGETLQSKNQFGYRHQKKFIFEEYIGGAEYSVELFLLNGELVFNYITAKRTSSPPYCDEIGHILPANISLELSSRLVSVSFQAVKAIGLTQGPMHVEVKFDGDRIRIIETNARPGGDFIATRLLPLASGIDLYKLHIMAMLNYPIDLPATSPQQAAAIRFVYPASSGIFQRLCGIDQATAIPGVVEVLQHKETGAYVHGGTDNNSRLAHVIAVGPTADHAEEAIEKAVAILTPVITSDPI
ncbi:hypothetical protein RvVAR0630_18430 [Agrobacterium vitis]|uniref:ATP-grasp domain-containing protein n=1 Tax=Agrobacterium vitis TaxID=373 RepID=UPI0015D7A5A6|nr:ATP-grasp domain-containing protein [Agrobacterium vitis]BCH59219.1 hypothetical protein RvVAR0630_18430 [Agrobacterium vitis]